MISLLISRKIISQKGNKRIVNREKRPPGKAGGHFCTIMGGAFSERRKI